MQSGTSSSLSQQSGMNNSSDYHTALSLLNESTLSQACALLLSNSDYEGMTEETDRTKKGKSQISDRQRLFNLHRKCHAASNIVRQYQTRKKQNIEKQTMPPLQTGNLRKPIQKQGLKQSTSTSRLLRSNINKSMKPPPPLHRASSDDSSANISLQSTSSSISTKQKQKSSTNSKDKNPPASALAFLAALNNSKKQSQKSSMKKMQSTENISDSNKELVDTPPSSPSLKSAKSPTRKLRSADQSPPPLSLDEDTPARRLRSSSTTTEESEKPKQKRQRTEKNDKEPDKILFEIGQDVLVQLDAADPNDLCNAIVMGLVDDGYYQVELDNGEILNRIHSDFVFELEKEKTP